MTSGPWTLLALLVPIATIVSGCAVQRAVVANDAQEKMVGLTKEQVLGCMGPPATKAAEGRTEVWSYRSGNGHVTTVASGFSQADASASGGPGFASGSATGVGFGAATTTSRYCVVNVAMTEGRVSRVNYVGPTGGLLTPGEQCAFAVQNCTR
jgi:hypothetical protein